jgi:4-amino-4-deoxy-L-arabinose transferase-like glycosyltransferase
VSEVFTSLGFLVAIIAVVTVNLLPRAKLIQMTFGICVSTAIAIPLAMLATWSGLQARYHTDPEGLHAYNSSQSGQQPPYNRTRVAQLTIL